METRVEVWKFGRTRNAVGTHAAGESFHSFICETTAEPQNIFLHLRKERNKC